jgi:PqqD family protein of HPr-rel-A system
MGEAIFLYHRRSGATHVLNLVSLSLLEFLAESPKSIREVIEHFPAYIGAERQECPAGVARRLFSELDDAGLLVRAMS